MDRNPLTADWTPAAALAEAESLLRDVVNCHVANGGHDYCSFHAAGVLRVNHWLAKQAAMKLTVSAAPGTPDVREAPRVPSNGDVWHLFPDDDLRGREITLLEHRRFEWSVDKSGWLTTDGGEVTDDQFANGTAVFVRAASPPIREPGLRGTFPDPRPNKPSEVT